MSYNTVGCSLTPPIDLRWLRILSVGFMYTSNVAFCVVPSLPNKSLPLYRPCKCISNLILSTGEMAQIFLHKDRDPSVDDQHPHKVAARCG